jgi:TRAP-type mannitol/chloroaromatic compound transport system substrate-binding protein
MITTKRILILVVVSTIALTLAMIPLVSACTPSAETPSPSTPAPGEEITWRHQCAYGQEDVEYQTLEPFFNALSVATNGKFTIKPFPGETIVPSEELLSATAEGVVEVCHASGGYWEGIVDIGSIESGLPAAYRGTLDEWLDLVYGTQLIEIYREAYAEQGVFLLGEHSVGGYPEVCSRVPIRRLSDYEGLKIRAWGGFADVFDAAGASVTWLPGAEIYMALKLGTIDAATWSAEGLIGYKWYEAAPYLIMPTMVDHLCSHLAINMQAWEALPDEYKDIYEGLYHEVYIPQLIANYDVEWKKIWDLEEALGYEVIYLPDESVEEIQRLAVEVVWTKEAAKSARCKQVIDTIKTYYGIT